MHIRMHTLIIHTPFTPCKNLPRYLALTCAPKAGMPQVTYPRRHSVLPVQAAEAKAKAEAKAEAEAKAKAEVPI